jgi:uncharacterized protein
MHTGPSPSPLGHVQVGSVAALWRYPVKSMMGEELNACEVTDRPARGPAVRGRGPGHRKGRRREESAEVGQLLRLPGRLHRALDDGSEDVPVRITLPDGTVVASNQADLEQILSRAFGREVAFQEARPGQMPAGATAEEYWPDMAGLGYRDTVTDFEMPAGTFFDSAVVHLLTTATINRLRALPRRPLRSLALPPQHRRVGRRRRGCGLCGKRLDRPHCRDRQHRSAGHHRTLPPLRDDHVAAG